MEKGIIINNHYQKEIQEQHRKGILNCRIGAKDNGHELEHPHKKLWTQQARKVPIVSILICLIQVTMTKLSPSSNTTRSKAGAATLVSIPSDRSIGLMC